MFNSNSLPLIYRLEFIYHEEDGHEEHNYTHNLLLPQQLELEQYYIDNARFPLRIAREDI